MSIIAVDTKSNWMNWIYIVGHMYCIPSPTLAYLYTNLISVYAKEMQHLYRPYMAASECKKRMSSSPVWAAVSTTDNKKFSQGYDHLITKSKWSFQKSPLLEEYSNSRFQVTSSDESGRAAYIPSVRVFSVWPYHVEIPPESMENETDWSFQYRSFKDKDHQRVLRSTKLRS